MTTNEHEINLSLSETVQKDPKTETLIKKYCEGSIDLLTKEQQYEKEQREDKHNDI